MKKVIISLLFAAMSTGAFAATDSEPTAVQADSTAVMPISLTQCEQCTHQGTASMPMPTKDNFLRLRSGTPIQISIASSNYRPYADVEGTVDADVYSADGLNVVIPRGSRVRLHGAYQPNGSCGKPGKLWLNCGTVTASDGKQIAISFPEIEFKGKGRGGLAHGLAWGLALPTNFVSCFFLLIKGGTPTLPVGYHIPAAAIEGAYTILPY